MPEQAPAISVVLPVLNGAATLSASLESLLAQTDPDFEIVVVDDGSQDDTPDLLRVMAERDARIRPVITPHRGIVAALNTGVAESRGALIARMDADDIAMPRRLATQRALLDADRSLGLVSCRVEHPDPEDAGREGYARYVAWLNELLTPEAIALNRFIESPVAHPSVMFRRTTWFAQGGYADGPFPEDYDMWLRWLEAGVRMAKVDEPLLVWHDRPGRLSRTHPRYSIEAIYRIKATYLARWLARHNPRHPDIVVWGSGSTSRQRAAHLVRAGCRIVGYIDIDPKRGGHSQGTPIRYYETLTSPDDGFVVGYVGKRGGKEFLRGHLAGLGFVEGRDFVQAAGP